MASPDFMTPDWPAPENIGAMITTRQGGVSRPPWDSWNLGDHVGDSPAAVAENRRILARAAGLDQRRFGWLTQVHGTALVQLTEAQLEAAIPEADASWTDARELACVIMTADCLPVLFCDRAGERVAAAHAGWRSLAAGILEKTAALFPQPDQVMAWLGPAIGPAAFEVGAEVRQAFLHLDPSLDRCFKARGDRYLADLYHLARCRLAAAGITAIYGGEGCTFSDPERFYSFRRDGRTGRMASLIWRA